MTHRWLVGTGVVLALAAALALIVAGGGASLAEDGIIYVDVDAPGPTHDGSTWECAFTDLQDALTEAGSGDQIWVAAGTYKPSVQHGGSGDRYRSFQMANGVALYGGFDPDGGDDEWEERDWVNNPTILSGDLDGDDEPGFVNNDENSFHVFYHPEGMNLDSTAILDGFTITGGNADSDWPLNCGGGMFNYASSPTLTNSTFSGNSARHSGGGMENLAGSAPTMANCTFIGNMADQYGGGMYNLSSSPVLTNSTFTGNWAGINGGGMFNYWSSSPTLTNCTFDGNSATNNGGGMYNRGESSPELTDCTFSGNSAYEGGGMYNDDYSSPTLTNSILWGDPPEEIYNDSPDNAPVVTYSDIQGGCEADPYNVCGDGNIDDDPLFVDPDNGDFHLGPGSPCIDAGSNTAPHLPQYDFEGDPRVADSDHDGTATADMGVDEVYETPPPVIFVDHEAGGANNGTSWNDAVTSLQAALVWALDGVEIWVAEGTYVPTWQFDAGDPRSATFQMANGVAIYGGFDPSVGKTAWGDRDWAANPTILSGDIGEEGNPDDNAYHVFYHPDGTDLDSTAILDGFTITGGNADGDASPYWDGGGMYNDGSSPTLANLTFTGNSARWGAGLYNYYNSAPVLTNCTFSGNAAVAEGGGIFNSHSSPALTNCTFSGNSASSAGAMLNGWDSSPTLTNCILWGDASPEISNEDSAPVVSYSDIQGSYPGTSNIDADPMFVDAASGDLHLGPGSPCIDAGSNTAPNLPETDFEGHPRIMDGDRDGTATVDMGVDEVFGYQVYLPLVLKGY